MTTPVVMPQMGESIAEGTIVRWIKKVGDQVDRDEPLFEISTDKVDAEIPSPAAGVLAEITVKEGETVAGQQRRRDDRRARSRRRRSRPRPQPTAVPRRRPTPAAGDAATRRRAAGRLAAHRGAAAGHRTTTTRARRDRRRSSARSRRNTTSTSAGLHGTGIGGRVTKHDILGFIEHRPATSPRHRACRLGDATAPALPAGRAPSRSCRCR